MTGFHFGYQKNIHVCDCGKHWGCGDEVPQTRAARAARMRDTMPELMPDAMILFLTDWEKNHGRVNYKMAVIGINSGSFSHESKGKELYGAVYIPPTTQNYRTAYAD